MKLVLSADHAGFELKEALRAHLQSQGHEVIDLGVFNTEPADYPDVAENVGLAVTDGRAERGILVCGSGVGAVISANKLPGVRAGLTHDAYSAEQGVQHDDMNVMVLGGRVIGSELAKDLARRFVEAKFQPLERYVRRLEKVKALEEKY